MTRAEPKPMTTPVERVRLRLTVRMMRGMRRTRGPRGCRMGRGGGGGLRPLPDRSVGDAALEDEVVAEHLGGARAVGDGDVRGGSGGRTGGLKGQVDLHGGR